MSPADLEGHCLCFTVGSIVISTQLVGVPYQGEVVFSWYEEGHHNVCVYFPMLPHIARLSKKGSVESVSMSSHVSLPILQG